MRGGKGFLNPHLRIRAESEEDEQERQGRLRMERF
jgi:hypothetical protein